MRPDSPEDSGVALAVLRNRLVVSLPEDPEEDDLERIRRCVLDSLRSRREEGVIFDMSAVRMIEPSVFRHLADTARMAALLGSEPAFAGFRPGAAAVLVDLGADVSGLRAFRTLEEAIGREDSPEGDRG